MNQTLIDIARHYCEGAGHRYTDPRRIVLEILSRAPRPLSAYDIIAAMGNGTKPPTVYRALEFWQAEGFIHNISSLNVFTVCHAGHRHAGSQYMICDGCGGVEEVHLCHLPAPLDRKIKERGFQLTRWNTEIHGLCEDCG